MRMEILKNDLLPAAAVSLLNTKVPETPDTNNTKEKGDELLFNDEIEEDDELFLRLSDDEEVKQDTTSAQIENQQIEKLDNNEDDCVSKGITTSPTNNSILHLSEITALVDEDSSGNSSLDEKGASENCNLNEDSKMSGNDRIPPLMHNSPKYWSNNFDKRWKGVNSSRGRHNFSHRNSNDWYNQQYPDKEKFNGRNNYSNQNKHFNQQRNSKGKYNPQSKESREISNSEKETEKSSNTLKANLSDVDDIINDMNQIIQENGDCDELKSKENKCTVVNEKLVVQENECNSNEERTSDKKCSDSDNIKHSINSECEPTDCKEKDLSATKDCDTTVSVLENVTSKPASESNSLDLENKFNSNEPEKFSDITKDLSDSKKDSVRESSTNITTTLSKNESLQNREDQNIILKDQINEHETKDEDNGDSNKDTQSQEKFQSEKLTNEVKESSVISNENNYEKSNGNSDITENSNVLMNETSIDISALEIDESHHNESKNKFDATKEDIDTNSNAETNAGPSNSISVADFKSGDTKELKLLADKDEEGTAEMSSLVIDENSQEKKMLLDDNEDESNESVKQQSKQNNSVDIKKKSNSVEIKASEKVTSLIEEVDLVDNESETAGSTSDQAETNSVENKNDADNLLTSNNNTSQLVPISTDSNKNNESNEEERIVVSKRRRRKRHNTLDDISMNELPIENGVRQKRRSARNAEEMIRKEILKDDEEDASSDEPSRMVPVNYRKAIIQAPPLSPPSLKRTVDELEDVNDSAAIKRLKATSEVTMTPTASLPSKEFVPVSKESSSEVKELVRRISTEDIRGKMKKLTQEEMEALLLQKTIECITIRGEMGKLREQARQSKLNYDAARSKCQQLQKQVEGFEMVLKRISYDKNSNSDKFIPPIKITRSVGLQVNFVTQAKQGAGSTLNASKTVSTAPASVTMENRPINQHSRKMMKTRSPRRVDMPTTGIVQTSNPVSVTTTVGGGGPVTPTAIVMNKTVDSTNKRTITLPSSTNIVQLMSGQQPVVVSTSVGGTTNRSATITIRPTAQQGNKSNSSDLIDLTDEEDKSKIPAASSVTTTITRPRVLQAFPTTVALTNATNLRLVQAGNQGSQTSIVNNVNAPRLTTYLMQSGANGMSRQLVLANPNTIRPVTSVATRNISTLSYKQGVPTITSGGTVRVLTTQTPTTTVQIPRHPAPLPETPAVESNPLWKLAPPAPSLKISKVATGIVLSWNMDLPNNKYAEIVSYQLYAYQEVAGTPPSATLWKKVGDVRALPLPMACTLTQFSEGNNYYFAVRAVDIHSRFGQYSKPGNISL